MGNVRLGAISLDCAEPEPLAQFWAHLLHGTIAFSSDDFIAVNLENVWITAVRVEEYQVPTWPSSEIEKQIHLDLAVKDLSLAAEEALSWGARRCEVQPAPDRYLVFLDPAGHPFCLTTQIPD